MKKIDESIFKNLLNKLTHSPSKILILVGLFFALILPFFTENPFLFQVVIIANIHAIFAVSWDFLAGYVGQVSLGHALFFGVGAYASALINLAGFSIPVAIIIGAGVACLSGLLIGIPCLRLKGPYLALGTLIFPLILTGVFISFPGLTGGEIGLSGFSTFSNDFNAYFTILLTLVVTVIVFWGIVNSKIGVMLRAIKEDEIVVESCGINVSKWKIVAFGLSGFFGGIAGGFYSHFMGQATLGTLAPHMSFMAVIWTMLGGLGTLIGPIVTIYIFAIIFDYLEVIPMGYNTLLMGIVFILVVVFYREGIVNFIQNAIEKECPGCNTKYFVTKNKCEECGTVLK